MNKLIIKYKEINFIKDLKNRGDHVKKYKIVEKNINYIF